LFTGRKMEVSEEDLPRPNQRHLVGLRLLDFDHEIRPFVDLWRGREDRGAMLRVLLIRDSGALARARLDQYCVSRFGERLSPGRNQRDTVLALLDLLGHTDDHG